MIVLCGLTELTFDGIQGRQIVVRRDQFGDHLRPFLASEAPKTALKI